MFTWVRLSQLQRTAEPNLSMVRQDHPFLRSNVLEDEANKLMEELITLLFTSTTPDIVSAVVTCVASLVKTRPVFANLVVTALTNWSPTSLTNAGHSNSQVRSVEKVVRVSLSHLLRSVSLSRCPWWRRRVSERSSRVEFTACRNSHVNAFSGQINEFLGRQLQRMEQAANEARLQRDSETKRKRQLLVDGIQTSVKRRRIDTAAPVDLSAFSFSAENPLAKFDASSLPLQLVVDLVVANLQIVTEATLATVIQVGSHQFTSLGPCSPDSASLILL